MNRDIKNVDVYNENLNFESDYLPLIAFKSEKQKNAVEQYTAVPAVMKYSSNN